MIANCTGKVPGLRPITGKRVSRNSCWRVMSCNLWQKAAITCKTCIARRVGKLGKVRQLLNYLKFEFIASDFSYKYRRFIFHSQKKRFRFFFFFFKRNSMTRRERERNTKFSFSRRLFFTSFRLKKNWNMWHTRVCFSERSIQVLAADTGCLTIFSLFFSMSKGNTKIYLDYDDAY